MIKTGQVYLYKPKKYAWYYLIYGAKLSGENLDKLDYLGLAFRDKIPEVTDMLFLTHLNSAAIDTLEWKMPILKNFNLTKEQIEKMQLVTYSPSLYGRIVNTRDLKSYVDTLEGYSTYIKAKYRREIGSVLFSQWSGYIVIFNIDATNIYYMEISKEIADMSEQKLKKYVIDVLVNRTQIVRAMNVLTFDSYFWNLYKTIDIKKDIVKLKVLKYI